MTAPTDTAVPTPVLDAPATVYRELTIRRQQYRAPFAYDTLPVNHACVKEILEYLFNSTAFKSNPELLPRKIVGWRQRLFEPNPLPEGVENDRRMAADRRAALAVPVRVWTVPEGPHTGEDWLEHAIAMKMVGWGWGRIESAVGRPRSTVRRVIADELTRRNLTPPAAVAGGAMSNVPELAEAAP